MATNTSYNRAYYLANRETIKSRSRTRALADPEATASYQREYRATHKERLAASRHRWHAENYAAYYAANAERKRAYARAHSQLPHVKILRAFNQRLRNARKRGAAGHATIDQVSARIAFYGGKCAYCGATATTIDHVIPVSRGGTNWPANLRPACLPCNCSKHDHPVTEFLQRRGHAARR